MTLTEFLRARLDEDEQAARTAGRVTWPSGTMRPDEEDFLNRFHDERVLAEVEAKRRIVNEHEPVILRGGSGARYYETTRVCRSCEPSRQFPESAVPCQTLKLLAMPYADHPDYDETWRPCPSDLRR